MKYAKYIAVALVVLATALFVANLYRDSIARNVANSVVGSYGLEVVDVSIDSIQPGHIRFGELELRRDDGTRIRGFGISLPTNIRSRQPGVIAIDEIEVIPADSGGAPIPVAEALSSVLNAPAAAPNTSVHIGRLSVPGLKSVFEVSWDSSATGQSARVASEGYDVDLDIEQGHNGQHELVFAANHAEGGEVLSANLQLLQTDNGFSVTGDVTIHPQPLLPVLHAGGALPERIASLEAKLAGQVTAEIADDASLPVRISSRLAPVGAVSAVDQLEGQPPLVLRFTSMEPVDTLFEYPSLTWSARTRQADLLASSDVIGNVAALLTDLECRSGIRCTLQTTIDTSDAAYAEWNFASVKASVPVELDLGAKTVINVPAGASLSMSGITHAGYSAKNVRLIRFSGASIAVDDSDWQLSLPELALDVADLRLDGEFVASFPLAMSNLHIRDSGGNASATVAILSSESGLSYRGTEIIAPDVNGDATFADGTLSANLMLSAADNGVGARIEAQHDTSSGIGSLRLTDAFLDFGSRDLSAFVRGWPYRWDVVSGTWSTNAELNWTVDGDTAIYRGGVEVAAADLAGSYGDLAFAGFSARTIADLDSQDGHSVAPVTLALALLDIGIPLEDISAVIEPDLNASTVEVDKLSMSALGGAVVAEPFDYRPGTAVNRIILRPQSIQLQLMMALANFDHVELTGSVSGSLPLTITDGGITITGGRLDSDPPGGVIRYRAPGGDGTDTGDSQLGLVTRALSNFQFESLSSGVNYSETGDLMLQMRLEGVNPDMDPTQPVVLNLSVDNNVPQLLRSLQATRSINDVLERKVSK